MRHPFDNKTTGNDCWFTPPEIVKALGPFALDPCTHIDRPWDTALNHYTIENDGLLMPWIGRVWMNPPYGKVLAEWLNKLALHGNGTTLVFNRSETAAFQNYVFPFADSILFMKGRITFYDINGELARTKSGVVANSGAPSIIIGYGENNSDSIAESGIDGHHQYLRGNLIVIGIAQEYDKTWKVVVGDAMKELDGKASVSDIYDTVMELAPKKVGGNQHYKAKIRQTLQRYFQKIGRGEYIN